MLSYECLEDLVMMRLTGAKFCWVHHNVINQESSKIGRKEMNVLSLLILLLIANSVFPQLFYFIYSLWGNHKN